MAACKTHCHSRRSMLRMLASTPLLMIAGERALAQPKRNWSVTGARVPHLDGLDLAMRSAMQAANIRAGELAVASAGKILFERGYTWAEPGYPITQPTSLFRIASVGKAFTVALTSELVRAGALSLDTRVFPYLDLYQYAHKDRPIDPRLNDITVIQLIENRSGLPRNEPNLREIAHKLGLHRAPVRHEVVGYVLGERLEFTPGTSELYSNVGHGILTLVCRKAANMEFFAALRKYVTDPLGIEVLEEHFLKEELLPGEVSYDDPGRSPNPLNPNREELLPNAYGGGVFYPKDTVPGVVTRASAVALLIGRYAAYNYGPRRRIARNGGQPGTFCWAVSRGDRLDYCYVLNTEDFGQGGPQVHSLLEKIDRVLDDSHDGCEASVYWDGEFKGDMWRSTHDQTNLNGGWNDQISSIQIASGKWEFYADEKYGGKVLKLAPGRYPFLGDDWNDTISSFRCVEGTLAQ
jgi:CubicO group peptidase (beta-lactamase class C family)